MSEQKPRYNFAEPADHQPDRTSNGIIILPREADGVDTSSHGPPEATIDDQGDLIYKTSIRDSQEFDALRQRFDVPEPNVPEPVMPPKKIFATDPSDDGDLTDYLDQFLASESNEAKEPDITFQTPNFGEKQPSMVVNTEMFALYCTKCGLKFQSDDKFCGYCGVKRSRIAPA